MTPAAVALYRRGPRWQADRPLGEQEALSDHIAFLMALARRDDVEAAGPFYALSERADGDVIGLVVFGEADTAREQVAADPAVLADVMTVEVLHWHR